MRRALEEMRRRRAEAGRRLRRRRAEAGEGMRAMALLVMLLAVTLGLRLAGG